MRGVRCEVRNKTKHNEYWTNIPLHERQEGGRQEGGREESHSPSAEMPLLRPDAVSRLASFLASLLGEGEGEWEEEEQDEEKSNGRSCMRM